MSGLVIPGGRPNGKLALWNALASIRTRLQSTAKKAGVLRGYLHSPLPDDLRAKLGGYTFDSTLSAYYKVESLWDRGELSLDDAGTTYESQAAWRDEVVRTIPGIGYKTASWALQLYRPDTCKILTLDIHHIRRLTDGTLESARNPLMYTALEQVLIDEADQLIEGTGFWRISGAAYIWAMQRNKYAKEFPDHSGLHCYPE